MQIDYSTHDTVNITVSAADQTEPKVLVINLNSTTIDVASVKFLHVLYDEHSIAPAASVNALLHTTSSD